jgi:hypothetical protein
MVDDAARVRLLRAWGVEALLLERPLAPGTPGVRLVASETGPLAPVLVYRLDHPAPIVRRVARARSAADPRAALAILLEPSFDPRREVVLPTTGQPAPASTSGLARVERDDGEELRIVTADDRPGWLVLSRDWQPQWKATLDGRPVPISMADLHRLAVTVPPGRHAVALFPDRAPLRLAAAAAALGLCGLLGLALVGPRRRGAPAGELP